MSKRKLPITGKKELTPEALQWCQEWDEGTHQEKLSLCKRWDISYIKGKKYRSDCRKVEPTSPLGGEGEQPIIYQPYPDFKIKPFPVGRITRAEEDIGIVISDPHLGKQTESYNLQIAEKRLDYLLSRLMRIIELHRPIRKAYIFLLGDNVQGENSYQGSKIGETEVGAWEQINDYAIPLLSRFSLSLAQGVSEVELDGVWGNHGVYDRHQATKKTNWDNFVYKGLETALSSQKRITVNCPKEFYQLVTIRGFRFFLVHGDQVKASSAIPLFALRRKLQEWYAYVGTFHYAYVGHFDTWGADQVNSEADYQISPPLVTGDEWALQVVGRASKPVQLAFGIHSKYGRSWEYKLFTDEKYLPKPMGV